MSLKYIRILQSRYRDTISSVGFLTSKSLPFTSSNSAIKTFRHALALDEVSFPHSISSVSIEMPYSVVPCTVLTFTNALPKTMCPTPTSRTEMVRLMPWKFGL